MSDAITPKTRGARCASTIESMRALRSNRSIVGEIEHTSTLQAENSCDLIRLRVQSNLKFGCSIRWTNKRRSITELNPDSHSQKPTVNSQGRQHTRTRRSCGLASAENRQASGTYQHRFLPSAGISPAFLFVRRDPSPRRAEFISVSGSRAARSAPCSDLRLKRTSGVAAATSQLHAPMNSPDLRAPARPGFHQPVRINC